MVSGKRENEIILQSLRASRRIQHDKVGSDLENSAVEVSRDLAGLNAVLDIRTHPVFDVGMNLGAAIDHRHTSAMPPEIERCFGGGVFSSHHDHIIVEIRM